MFPGPNGLFKPLIGIVWLGYVVLLGMAIFTNKIGLLSAAIQFSTLIFLYIGWSSGAYHYFLSGNFHITGASLFIKLKGKLIQLCSSFIYLIFLLPIFFFESSHRYQKAVYFLVLSLLSLYWVFLLYKRIRLIEDTASTQLSSAAQGYAELEGKVRLYDNETARGPNPELPIMVWYAKDTFSSTAGFILEDDKGRCTIDPHNAEVITPSYRYNDHAYKAIYPGETIYVLGYLETLNKHRTEHERQAMVSRQIAEWKSNRFRFLDFFDKNHDGEIDDSEMFLARDTAINHVDRKLESIYQAPATHVISSPSDGRPFILSSVHPDKLLKKYKIALLLHTFIWLYLSILVIAMQVA